MAGNCSNGVHKYTMHLFRCGLSLGTADRKKLSNVGHSLMTDFGLVARTAPGIFALLPEAVRALHKLEQIIRREMTAIGGIEIQTASMTSRHLWDESGRWDRMDRELFKLADRNGVEYCLQPTAEEQITTLVKYSSWGHFPLNLYQITEKYRDESAVKYGLLRTRQFLMKDAYSFDVDKAGLDKSYENYIQAYLRIFRDILKLNVLMVEADGGAMGAAGSNHEFHLPVSNGQDTVLHCADCRTGHNTELDTRSPMCPSCDRPMIKHSTIEIGHTFKLGQTYSKLFGTNHPNIPDQPLEMGCYGIGLTRLLAACLDHYSTKHCIRWPDVITPYKLVAQFDFVENLHDPSERRKHRREGVWIEHVGSGLRLNQSLSLPSRANRVRRSLTAGRKMQEGLRRGFPLIIVGNKTLCQQPVPKFEVLTPFDVLLSPTGNYTNKQGDSQQQTKGEDVTNDNKPKTLFYTHQELFMNLPKLISV